MGVGAENGTSLKLAMKLKLMGGGFANASWFLYSGDSVSYF